MEKFWKNLPEELYIKIIRKIEDPITRHELGLKPRKIKDINEKYNHINFPTSVCKYVYLKETYTFITILSQNLNENLLFRADCPVLYNGNYEFQYLDNETEIRVSCNYETWNRKVSNNFTVHINYALIK